MKKWTERFALQLVKDHGHLKSFLVDLTGFAEATDIATVLRAQGCLVAVHSTKNRVIVTRGCRPLV
jgi:hypothetical protein